MIDSLDRQDLTPFLHPNIVAPVTSAVASWPVEEGLGYPAPRHGSVACRTSVTA
jgi:hypothetical protein